MFRAKGRQAESKLSICNLKSKGRKQTNNSQSKAQNQTNEMAVNYTAIKVHMLLGATCCSMYLHDFCL